MARQQIPKQIALNFGTTAVQISSSQILCTSFIVQNEPTGSDFIRLGNATGQIHFIAPGKDLAIHGDGLDNGTTAYLDLSQWYVVAESGTQDANVSYLERF